jgi:ankyrin repeat protein
LLPAGANLESESKKGLTPLKLAALRGRPASLVTLLDAGASMGPSAGGTSKTALHMASGTTSTDGSEACVLALLAAGASVDAADKEGVTPLHEAALPGNITCMQLLLGAGASTTAVTHTGCTALHIAAMQGHDTGVQLLLEAGADTPQE